MAIQVFTAESALLRVMKIADQQGAEATGLQADIVHTYLYDAADAIHKSGKDAIIAFLEGDEQRMVLM